MTSTVIEPRQVDSGRVDEGGRQWPIVLAVLIIGLVIGGLVGGVYGATRPTSYEASTALSVQPDPTIDVTSQNSNQNSTPTLDASAYIQSQLVIINGAQLADRVRDAENLPSRPEVTATQVGQTYVVDITASAASKSRAAAIARETGAQYIAERSSLLRAEIKSLLTSTSQQLKGVAASLTAQRSRSTTSPLTPSQTALQTEYERLLSVRSTLNAVSAQASQVVTVVSPARATDSSLSSTEKDLLGGAVIGAILALIVFLTLRRTVHRVRSVADLAALDVPVILPVQPKRSLRQARKHEFWKSPQARLLAARLFAEADVDRRPLVFVGTAAGVGNTSVAASVAAALVDSGPVLFVQVDPTVQADASDHASTGSSDEPSSGSPVIVPSSLPGVWLLDDPQSEVGDGATSTQRLTRLLDDVNRAGWIVIVDAPPLSESDVAARCSRSGAALILVVGRGRSTPAGVLAASELFEAHGTGMIGAVLNNTVGPLRRALERRSKDLGADVRPSGGRHADTTSTDTIADHAASDDTVSNGTAANDTVLDDDMHDGPAEGWSRPEDHAQEDGESWLPGLTGRPSR